MYIIYYINTKINCMLLIFVKVVIFALEFVSNPNCPTLLRPDPYMLPSLNNITVALIEQDMCIGIRSFGVNNCVNE